MEINKIIEKKENRQENSKEEIEIMVMGFTNGSISKETMTRYIKAIYENGMSDGEIFDLTEVMTNSGKVLSYEGEQGVFVDKHSTGGVSDSTTIILSPLIALSGLKFMKMSGRKLGYTGGTADKIEQFKGFRADISLEEAKKLVRKNGACQLTQTEELAPADKYIYKLRDETGYVMSIPLIASSVMSKKLACGCDVIVLDVKCGNGAFMKDVENATKLSEIMVKIGQNKGKKVAAVVSDMNEPLGENIGSLMEAIETIEVLEGKKGKLHDLAVVLAAKIIELGKNIPFEKAKVEVEEYISSGRALEKMKQLISAQNGSLELFNKDVREQIYCKRIDLTSTKEGYITEIDCMKLGYLSHSYCDEGNSGLKVYKRVGDYIKVGEKLISLYGKETKLDFLNVFKIGENKPLNLNPLVYEIID